MLEEQDRIGRSLGLAKNLNVLKKVLEFAISEDVRSQDTVFIMISVGMNKVGRPLAWNFFKENKKFLGERYPVSFGSTTVIYVNEIHVGILMKII